MKNNPIAFFDSGVGLFSVLDQTRKILPLENYVIFADQDHNPYGEKTRQQIVSYTEGATQFLLSKHRIKMLVLACNTATVLALEKLRKKFDIPIIGTVPAVKVACQDPKARRVVVMSTPATAKSAYLKDLIGRFSTGKKTLTVGCVGLEEAIEILDRVKIDKVLNKYIPKIEKFHPDTVVLGCTHYPLIRKEIEARLEKVKVIDSGEAIAKQIKRVLQDSGLASQKRTGDVYYTTGDVSIFSKITSKILKQKIKSARALV